MPTITGRKHTLAFYKKKTLAKSSTRHPSRIRHSQPVSKPIESKAEYPSHLVKLAKRQCQSPRYSQLRKSRICNHNVVTKLPLQKKPTHTPTAQAEKHELKIAGATKQKPKPCVTCIRQGSARGRLSHSIVRIGPREVAHLKADSFLLPDTSSAHRKLGPNEVEKLAIA